MLKSSEVGALCMSAAKNTAERAGNGFAVESRNYKERTGAAVFPVTYEAFKAMVQGNSLLKAVGK